MYFNPENTTEKTGDGRKNCQICKNKDRPMKLVILASQLGVTKLSNTKIKLVL